MYINSIYLVFSGKMKDFQNRCPINTLQTLKAWRQWTLVSGQWGGVGSLVRFDRFPDCIKNGVYSKPEFYFIKSKRTLKLY